MSLSYADEPYFHKSPRIDEQFGVCQQLIQQNIELEVTNSSKSKLKVKITDFLV
jgi:hypothetical protein